MAGHTDRNIVEGDIDGGGGRNDLLPAVHAQVGIQRHEGHDRGESILLKLDHLNEYVLQMDQRHTHQISTVHWFMQRIRLQAVQRPRVDGIVEGGREAGIVARVNATLVKNPRSLHISTNLVSEGKSLPRIGQLLREVG
jgi:hypothetical protein